MHSKITSGTNGVHDKDTGLDPETKFSELGIKTAAL